SIISTGQIEYMLEKFQSPSAIERAIAEGYEYFLAKRLGASVGYMGIQANEPHGKLFLSKIYLLKEYRGKGYAKDMIAQLVEMAQQLRLKSIWLTVNKGNPSVEAYKKMGFTVVRDQVADIGGGYVMDDHIMEKEV
ncbi:GNAT family N-acetyltransferase, partial [Christensenellaceae bacterium OttesenSCG-928-K19]|nr:GNAT family N-acetyltransferase [Christensenellaceae bacterium OttesenSCG-928-K19]